MEMYALFTTNGNMDGVFVLIMLGLLVLTILVSRIWTQISLDQSAEQIRLKRQECSTNPLGSETIGVYLFAYGTNAEAVETVRELYRQADCPYRVFVGLVHTVSSESDPDLYHATVHENVSSVRTYADQVQYTRVHLGHSTGPLTQMYRWSQHAWTKTKHVVVMGDHLHVRKGWDTLVTENESSIVTHMAGPTEHSIGYTVFDGFDDGTGMIQTKTVVTNTLPKAYTPHPWLMRDWMSMPRRVWNGLVEPHLYCVPDHDEVIQSTRATVPIVMPTRPFVWTRLLSRPSWEMFAVQTRTNPELAKIKYHTIRGVQDCWKIPVTPTTRIYSDEDATIPELAIPRVPDRWGVNVVQQKANDLIGRGVVTNDSASTRLFKTGTVYVPGTEPRTS